MFPHRVSGDKTQLKRGQRKLSRSGVLSCPALPRSPHRNTRELVETRKCEIDSALAAETARRERSEGRRQELERSTTLLSEELEVMMLCSFSLLGGGSEYHSSAIISIISRARG